jgi:hypothetical protein
LLGISNISIAPSEDTFHFTLNGKLLIG